MLECFGQKIILFEGSLLTMSDADEYTVSQILESLKGNRKSSVYTEETTISEAHEIKDLNLDEVVKIASNINQQPSKSLKVGFKLTTKSQSDIHTGMANLNGNPKHNICAYLNSGTKFASSYAEIIAFLQRSRIFYAISTKYDAYKSHQQLFWRNAELDSEVVPPVIKGDIMGHEITVSAANIRHALRFGDEPDNLIDLDPYLIRGCFLRMKYDGDVGVGTLNKAHLCPQYKYLMHVIIHCLGPRKGGFDVVRETLQSAMVALVLNRPYNFSEMIFHHLKENINKKGSDKFFMYPRFLQMVFDEQVHDLPKDDADKMAFEHMSDVTLNRLGIYRGRDTKPPVKRMFGHLANADYVAPPSNKWRHEDSDSDEEDIVVPQGDDDQGGDSDQGDGNDNQNVQDEPVNAEPQTEEPQQTEVVSETGSSDSESIDSESGNYAFVQVNAQLVAKKRCLESTQVRSSGRQGSDVEDADYVVDIPSCPPKKRSKAETSKEKVKGKSGKRRKFEIVRRHPVTPSTTQPQDSTSLGVTTETPTASIPVSTAPQQASVTLSQAFASLSEALGGQSVMSIAPTGSPTVPAIQTPITITFSPLPATTPGGESSSLPLQEQINNLNSLVKMLIKMNKENQKKLEKHAENERKFMKIVKYHNATSAKHEQDLVKAKEEINQLQLTVIQDSLKIAKLEDENQKLKAFVDELMIKIPVTP